VAPSYLVRRGVRIFPAYWVALTLLAIWPGLQFVFTGHWWLYYGLLQVYSPGHQIHGISVAWSLCVEVSFYLVLPLLALFLARRGVGSQNSRALTWELGTLATLAGLSLLFRVYVESSPDTVYLGTTILGTFSWFCAGMLLAAIQVAHPAALGRARSVLSQPKICWPLALALFAPLALEVTRHIGWAGPRAGLEGLLLTLAAGCLLGPVTLGDGSRAVRWTLANRVAIFIGTVSYGIYLWHLPIMEWLTSTHLVVDSPFPVALLAALSIACAVALGTATWFLIEKPLMLRVRSVKAFTHVRERTVEIPADVGPRPSSDSPEDDQGVCNSALASEPTS
jgi:peptidoglycan/LPS O-acetylase OafA/YrhL